MPLSQKSLEHLARGISARVGVVKKRKRHNSDSSDDPDYQCSSFRDDKKSIEKPAKITEPKPKLKEEREVPDLPGEILHRIFLLAIKDVGAIPLLFNLRGVSKRFKDVVEIPNSQLWNELDLSQVDFQKRSKTNCLSAVIRICRNGNLTRSLSLRGSSLTIEMFEELLLIMPNLTTLDLSYCAWLSPEILFAQNGLISNLTSLKSLSLSGLFKKKPMKCVEPFKLILSPMELTSLTLSDNCLADLSKVITTGDVLGPQLTELDISNCTSSGSLKPIPIINFLQTFPQIQVFKAVESQFDWLFPKHLQISVSNFPALISLTEVDISYTNRSCFGYDHTGLLRILSLCPNLTRVRLNKHSKLQWTELVPLLSKNLVQLSVANCGLTGNFTPENLPNSLVLSLTHLNISWLNDVIFAAFLSMLISCDTNDSKLEELQLVGTTVSDKDLKKILICHPRLRLLDISSCRAMQSGLKRSYNDSNEMENLRKILK